MLAPNSSARARVAAPADHAAFLALLARPWEPSNGYHESVRARWHAEWPGILAEFEAFLVVEVDGVPIGYAGMQRHPIPYTRGLERALFDHFLAPGWPPGLAIAALVQALGVWAERQGFLRLTLNMEPEEIDLCRALGEVGGFAERVAMFTGRFPEPAADPTVRPARPDELSAIVTMGARIADGLCAYRGSLEHPAFEELERLTAASYQDYGATRPHRTFVAERDGQLAGFCFAVLEPNNGGLIFDLYTEPTWRRQGISRALYVAATTWLREQGAQWLTLSVYAENMPAYLAYCHWGFFPYFVAWELNLRS